ncbi:Ig-like domain repeat protein [Salmonella enterica]
MGNYYVSNNSNVDLTKYGSLADAKISINGSDLVIKFESNEIHIINGALYSSLNGSGIVVTFSDTAVAGKTLLDKVDLQNVNLTHLSQDVINNQHTQNIDKEELEKELAKTKEELKHLAEHVKQEQHSEHSLLQEMHQILQQDARQQDFSNPQSDVHLKDFDFEYDEQMDNVEQREFMVLSDPSSSVSAPPETPSGGNLPSITLELVDSSDSGIARDNVTNDICPMVAGKSQADSIVYISINGVVVGETTTDASGNFSYIIDRNLPDGSYSVQATTIYPSGAQEKSGINITIDTHVSVPEISLALNNDTGISNVDGVTNINSPVLTISNIDPDAASVKATITNDNGELISASTASENDDGTWSFNVGQQLPDGVYVISVTVTDIAGNSATSVPVDIRIDTTISPVTANLLSSDDTGSSSIDGITMHKNVSVTGNAESGSIITIYDSNGIPVSTTTADNEGHWEVTLNSLPEGSNIFTITSQDAAGNISETVINIDCDTSTFVTNLTITDETNSGALTDLITNNSSPVITANGEVGSSVDIIVNGVKVDTISVGDDGVITYELKSLPDGEYSVQLVTTDVAGNTATSEAISVTVDTHISQFSISMSSLTNDTTPALSGKGEAGSTIDVYVDGRHVDELAVDSNGNWSTNLSLGPDGVYSVSVVITDIAGNTETKTASLTLDTHIDTPTIVFPASQDSADPTDMITNVSKPTFSGEGEVGDTITVYVDGKSYATTTVDSQGNWTYEFSNSLSDGAHSIYVVANDAAGNRATSDTISLTIDTVAQINTPTLVSDDGLYNNDNITGNNNPGFKISGEVGETVIIYLDGKPVDTIVLTQSSQNWQYTQTLDDGVHTLQYSVTDVAGNTSISDVTNFTIDTHYDATLLVTSVEGVQVTANTDVIYITDNPATISLNGEGEADSKITIYIDGVQVASVLADNSGNWQADIDSGKFPPQENASVQIISEDVGGNTSEVDYTIRVDNQVDGLTLQLDNPIANTSGAEDSPVVWKSNSESLDFSGTGEAGATVSIMIGGVIVASCIVDSNGQWSTESSPVSDGTWSVTIEETDVAGNTMEYTHDIVIDTTPPQTPDIEYSSYIDEQGIVVLSGMGEPDSTIYLTDSAGNIIAQATVSDDGSWTLSAKYTSGTDYSVYSVDSFGNQSPAVAVNGSTDANTWPTDSIDNINHLLITNADTHTVVFSDIPNSASSVDIIWQGKTYALVHDDDGSWSIPGNVVHENGVYEVNLAIHYADGSTSYMNEFVVVDIPQAKSASHQDLSHVSDLIPHMVDHHVEHSGGFDKHKLADIFHHASESHPNSVPASVTRSEHTPLEHTSIDAFAQFMHKMEHHSSVSEKITGLNDAFAKNHEGEHRGLSGNHQVNIIRHFITHAYNEHIHNADEHHHSIHTNHHI